jgi:hypothetical protein
VISERKRRGSHHLVSIFFCPPSDLHVPHHRTFFLLVLVLLYISFFMNSFGCWVSDTNGEDKENTIVGLLAHPNTPQGNKPMLTPKSSVARMTPKSPMIVDFKTLGLIRNAPDNNTLKKMLAQWFLKSDLLYFVSYPLSYWAELISNLLECLGTLFEENSMSRELLLFAVLYTDRYIEKCGLTHERLHLLLTR